MNTGKGLEDKTFNRLSDVLKEEFPENKITILSGPSHAEEVVKSMPTTVVVASDDIDAAYYVQDILSNRHSEFMLVMMLLDASLAVH